MFLSLGPTPLANSFLASREDFEHEAFYPLDVYLCESCGLVQLLDVIDPEVLFRDYIYVSGTSETLAAHNRDYARFVIGRERIGPDDLVIEIASNDGSLLTAFQSHGARVLGIEPATNIATIAEDAGVPTVNVFLDSRSAEEVAGAHPPARAVIANNVLAHVDETVDFLRGCRSLLAEDGLLSIEVPYLAELLERREFDTIYHEHLCYFSVTGLLQPFRTAGLRIEEIVRVPIHGGSLRILARPVANGADHAEEVVALAQQERDEGLTSLARYRAFAAEVVGMRDALLQLVGDLKTGGRTLAGYSAPAKGNTLLNYCGIDTRLLPFTVDRSPHKQGLYTPGTHIPVLPVPSLLEILPDFTLILAWNFADEIVRQQREYLARGGQFVVPVPEPRLLTG